MVLAGAWSGMKLNAGRHWVPAPGRHSFSAGLVTPPAAYGRIVGTPCVAGDNQTIGDCFPTACCNAVQTQSARSGVFVPVADSVAVAAYSGMTGYTALSPATDQGTDPEAGFSWWRDNTIAGFKLVEAKAIAPGDEDQVRAAIASAGGVLLCVELSTDNQNQRVWEPVGQAGSWGGHAVWCDEYDGEIYRVTSWGEAFYISRSYFATPGFVAGVYALEMAQG